MIKILRNDNIIALTTDRENGFSKGKYHSNNFGYHVKDNKKNVDQNYDQLCFMTSINRDKLYIPSQTHSDIFKEITIDSAKDIPNCDALYTKENDIYLGVLTADCLPVLLYCPDKEIVAAIHAGWVGSAKLIVYKLLNYLIQHEGINPEKTIAYLGPSISQDVYEVGEDVYKQITQHEIFNPHECFIKKENGKYLYDNRLFNEKQLLFCGIQPDNIIKVTECTYSNKNYFSYRRDKETGRQLTLIGMRK